MTLFSACRLLEIFAVEVYSCPKSSSLFITHEPLQLAWWNFARTCISTTSRTVLNFKVIGQRSRSHVFFGVFLCAWYCGYPWTVLSLEQGLTILNWLILILDGSKILKRGLRSSDTRTLVGPCGYLRHVYWYKLLAVNRRSLEIWSQITSRTSSSIFLLISSSVCFTVALVVWKLT